MLNSVSTLNVEWRSLEMVSIEKINQFSSLCDKHIGSPIRKSLRALSTNSTDVGISKNYS